MAEPAFATKWHFMVAPVLFGVHEQTGELLLVQDAAGAPTWMCWTDLELGRRQLPPGYKLNQANAGEMLRVLPAGVGVVIDPATERAMTLAADYVEQLRPQTAMFPGGVEISWRLWDGLPRKAVKKLVELGRGYAFVSRLWLVEFRVEDGPLQGAVVYECAEGSEAEESVVNAVIGALDRYVKLEELPGGPVGVQVVAFSDLPEQTQSWIGDQPATYTR